MRILSWEGANKRVSGNFFKAVVQAVVQAVLLFGAKAWVLTPRIERALESFLNRAARRITGRQTLRRGYEKWTYPPLKEAIREAGFAEIQKSITNRPNTVAQ